MLVISRKIGEAFIIGNNVEVTILNISGKNVSVGIQAPREINIARKELADTIRVNQESKNTVSGINAEAIKKLKSIGIKKIEGKFSSKTEVTEKSAD